MAVLAARNTALLPRYRSGEFKVFSYDPATNTIVLEKTPDTLREMPISLRADRGRFHAALTPTIDTKGLPDGQVRRKIGRIFVGDADTLKDGWISGWCADSPADFGLEFEDVEVSSDASESRPAWLIEPTGANKEFWTIHVHGRTAARQETIRSLQASAAAKVSAMAISYRAEAEARKSSRDRMSTLGLTESDDVLLAMNWLTHNRGAKRFVLVGWSLGAAVAAEALRRVQNEGTVIGLVVISGVVDVERTLKTQASDAGHPVIAELAIRLMRSRWHLLAGLRRPLDVASLGLAKMAIDAVPQTLFLHSTDDLYVRIEPIREMVSNAPDRLRLVEFNGGGHVKEWNSDPANFTSSIRDWLVDLAAKLE